MYRPTTNDDNLKSGLTVSAGLHLAMFLFLYFGLPRLIPPLPAHRDPVPIQIVTIADITNTRVDNKPEEPKPPAPPPQPQPKPAPAPTPPPKPAPPQPAPPAPATPTPPQPQAEALKPKPVEKPKPAPVKPAAPQPDLASVLKNVAKLKPAPTVKEPDATAEVKTPTQPSNSAAPSLSTRLTITEEDALRRQIEQCWSFPIGARDADKLIVEVIIDVNADRTVINAEIVDKMRYASDSFFRAAADAAIRAVRNPKCNPLLLPADKYEQWKRIDFTFDPRDM